MPRFNHYPTRRREARVISLSGCFWPEPAALAFQGRMAATDPLQTFEFRWTTLLTNEFDTQFAEHKARSCEAFLRRRRYVGLFVFLVLAVFGVISVMAGVFYYRQAPVGQAVLVTVSLIVIGAVEWFALTRNRKRDRPIPEPLLHGLSVILMLVLLSVIFALT